ncbi:DnaJ domain-containing protein [Kaistia geumhonensis]|uniref:J domain-containing protein n=1 Tax=Kaistia geumhonensis TaxID=410839 RepID=A0ABU0M2A5_9HYPH|nr:DnaJ domain-containing protein [Kaistia geumhonensis]MCX5479692.1 DnaJ domain-containing protein [Kaistia geumhonensis]MDQ0515084.1 hypothetical protein [Kaistia geumhonensis]
MGFILPLAAVAIIAIALAWTFGPKTGPDRLQKAIRKGGAGTLFALAILFSVTGKIWAAVPLVAVALSLWRPAFLERFGAIRGGRITMGRFAGRRLDELDANALLALHAELAGRPADRSVLEAYLDRRIPGWREHVERDPAGGPRRPAGTGAMTDEQAYKILGLSPGATEAEISAAYRRLMKRVHPDQGGSTFLAAQINEAKERLLGRHR